MKLTVIGLLFALAGCQSAPRQDMQQAYTQALYNQCANYGFTVGTDAFAQCLQTEHQQFTSRVNAAQQQATPYCYQIGNNFVRGNMRAQGRCQ